MEIFPRTASLVPQDGDLVGGERQKNRNPAEAAQNADRGRRSEEADQAPKPPVATS